MSKKSINYLALLIFVSASPPILASGDDGESRTVCERTAETMLQACRFDVRDDTATTMANCLNITDRTERRACKKTVATTRREDNQTCKDVQDSREETCELLGENRYDPDPLLDDENEFIHPKDIPDRYAANPYFSLEQGLTYVLRAGEDGVETDVIHVTGETRNINGVNCRIVADVVVEASEDGGDIDYEVVEATDDLYAQNTVGDVIYCAEISRNFEDGVLRDLDGSFESGIDFAKSGILIRAFPFTGQADRQEFALGEAEDVVQYIELTTAPTAAEGGDNPVFPCSPDSCVKTFEYAPLEPEASEFKYYLYGTGFVLGVSMEDGIATGERDELLCLGESLEILQDPACEIDDPEALLDALCASSPAAFCE